MKHPFRKVRIESSALLTERLGSCFETLRSCLGTTASLEEPLGYTEVLITFDEETSGDRLRRWLREFGARHFVERDPGLLSCIVEDLPEMLDELEHLEGIRRVQRGGSAAFYGGRVAQVCL